MRLLFALTLAAAVSARGADSVLLVVNGDSWASTCVANEYAAARGIPDANIVELHDLPSFEQMGVQEFRERILQPALRAADQRGLAGQLDYVLYSADFPTAIDVTADMAGRTFPKAITQPASINGLTFFYQFTLGKNPAYLGLNSNFYFRGRAEVNPEAPWPETDQKKYAEALRQLASAPKDQNGPPGDSALQSARDALVALKASHGKSTELLYNLACVHARLGEGDEAVAALREAVQNGWWDLRQAAADPDLATVRERADFKALAELARGIQYVQAPSGGFRGMAGWQPGGRLVAPAQGVRYLLSTVLACTSGRGNSVKEALASLRRSVAADASHPTGTIYYMRNGDVRSTTREWGFEPAAQRLRELGIAARVEEGVLPSHRADVAGLMAGTADFEWSKSGSTILPGAICEHLTSFGGMLREGDSQTPLTEFIRAGAAGSSGAVTEPFALQAKFPTPFLQFHYARGSTLAEAYYQSVAGPYQLLIVGDALCAPWRRKFDVSVEGLAVGGTLKGVAPIRPVARLEPGLKAGSFELHMDGRRIAVARPGDAFGLDTATFPDGAHTLTLVGSLDDAMAERSETALPVTIRNHADSLHVTAPAGDWGWDRPLEISAEAKGASAILFRRHGAELARIAGEQGKVTLDARLLGQGPVWIQPSAVMDGGREVWGEPIHLRVAPPAALPARDPGGPLEKGFAVTPEGGTRTIVQRAEGDWLAKAGVGADGRFVVEGWFNVPEEDVYQFQMRGAGDLQVTVDGRGQPWPHGSEWWFVPVSLAPGTHQVRIAGKARGTAPLELRFGGPGSRRLDGVKFQHQP